MIGNSIIRRKVCHREEEVQAPEAHEAEAVREAAPEVGAVHQEGVVAHPIAVLTKAHIAITAELHR